MSRRAASAFVLFAVVATHAAEEASPSCAAAAARPCVIELQGPGAPKFSASCTSDPWPRYLRPLLPNKAVDANADGWWETLLEVALDAEGDCGCVKFRIHFAEPLYGFSVDLGDSPTSDGYGGDAGTTFDEAELQILADVLTVYTSSRGRGTQAVGKMFETTLPSSPNRLLDIEICEELVVLEMPGVLPGKKALKLRLSADVVGGLFRFSREAGAPGKDRGLYAGFNRVVYRPKDGLGRLGTGVRRVEITLSR